MSTSECMMIRDCRELEKEGRPSVPPQFLKPSAAIESDILSVTSKTSQSRSTF